MITSATIAHLDASRVVVVNRRQAEIGTVERSAWQPIRAAGRCGMLACRATFRRPTYVMELHRAIVCRGDHFGGVASWQEFDPEYVEVMTCVDAQRPTLCMRVAPKQHLHALTALTSSARNSNADAHISCVSTRPTRARSSLWYAKMRCRVHSRCRRRGVSGARVCHPRPTPATNQSRSTQVCSRSRCGPEVDAGSPALWQSV
jgi:hypothetical protein